MKKHLLLSFLFLIGANLTQAKKIKFAVDMGTYTVSPLGVHVMGDFQTIAGFTGGDFNPATTTLTQEGSSTIYSVILDLPAFQKYEFKYVNGDQTYESEFVPEQSRVGYLFNDNRWVYVDSLQNDTTFAGAVMFSGNAPAGKTLIRFVVDMQNVGPISSNGVHVAGSFQGFDPLKIRLYSFGNSIYEIITYMNSIGVQEFKYYNGNTLAQSETVPSNCATSGNRTTNVVSDSVLVTVCYDGCSACIPSGLTKNKIDYQSLNLYPNPAGNEITLKLNDMQKGDKITVIDVSGKIVLDKKMTENTNETKLNLSHLTSGVYQLYYSGQTGVKHSKLIVD